MPETFLKYEVRCALCDAVYIGQTQKTLKTFMGGHLSNLLCLLKTDKNLTHFLPISDSTLNILRHAYTYVSA